MIYKHYSDDNHGIEHLSEFDYGRQDYCFDIIILLRDKTDQKVYIGQDSGCSCPTPFEYHDFPTDYTQVTSYDEVVQFVRNTVHQAAFEIPYSFREAAQKALSA